MSGYFFVHGSGLPKDGLYCPANEYKDWLLQMVGGKTTSDLACLKADDAMRILKTLEETEVTGEVVGVAKEEGKRKPPCPIEGRLLCFPGILKSMPKERVQQRWQRVQDCALRQLAPHAHAHAQALAFTPALPQPPTQQQQQQQQAGDEAALRKKEEAQAQTKKEEEQEQANKEKARCAHADPAAHMRGVSGSFPPPQGEPPQQLLPRQPPCPPLQGEERVVQLLRSCWQAHRRGLSVCQRCRRW